MVGIGGGGGGGGNGGGGAATHYHQVYINDNDDNFGSNVTLTTSTTPTTSTAGTIKRKKVPITITTASTDNTHPQKAHKWRPWPLQPWYFILIILIHIISIITLQLITAFCTPYGCHLFGKRSNSEVSVLDRVIYQAMPPSFSVCFGFLWMVVRHDVYRMEPYFQLSKKEGASAVDSLLMQYTHVLPHSIFLGAVRKRHWVILLTFTISTFISLGASPVLSGLFDQKLVQSSRNLEGKSLLFSKEHWEMKFPPAFPDVYFDIVKYNGSLPTFTTEEFALHPIVVAPGSLLPVEETGINETFTADTTLYEASLDCKPAAKIEHRTIYTPALPTNVSDPKQEWWAYKQRWVFHVNITSQEGLKASVILCYTEQSFEGWYDPVARMTRIRDNKNMLYCDYIFTLRPGTIFNQGGMMGSFIGFSDILRPNTTGKGAEVDGAEPGWLWSLWLGQYDMRNIRSNNSDAFDPSLVGASAMFCRPVYTKQDVRATLTRAGDVVKVKRTGKKKLFNDVARSFEENLQDTERRRWDGVRAGTHDTSMRSIEQKPLDLQFGRPQSSISLVKIKDVAQSMYSCFVANTTDPDYEIYLGSFTSSNCAGLSPQSLFAYSSLLAKLPDDANKFLEFDYTRNIFERVYKSLFALAMAAKMGNIAANPPKEIVTDAVSLTVIVESSFRGFRPNKIWTRLGQGILALLTILVSVLGIVLWKRNLALEGEPNTLSEALHLLANSTTLRKKLTGAEYSSRSELREGLRREAAYMRFRAVLKPGKGTMVEVSNIAHDNAAAKELGIPQPHVNIVETGGPKKLFLDNLQWQLKKRYNTLLIIAVAGMGTCLAIAAMYLQRLDGLPTIGHSTSSIKYKVVYTYLPFVVSNALSPVIASLARMHCMIAPYLLLKQARRSRWHASRSSRFLGLDLDGLPPQLQFFRALKFRQFAIAGLSVAFVLSNVLSITMTSLFSPISRDVVLTAPMLNVPLPAIDEPNMVPGVVATALLRNLTGSTFATTWTTPEYYVLPFKPQSLEPGSRTYTGETLGIGAKVQCTEFPISFWQSGFKKNTTDSKISEKGFGYIAANVAWDIDVSIQFDLATPAKFPATTTYWPNYTNPAVGLRTEYTNTDYMALGWIEWPGNPTPGIPPPAPPITNRTTPGSEKLAPYFKNNWDTVGITCRAEHRASRLLATVDVGTLKILNYTVLREINQGEVQAMADKIYYLFVAPNLKQTIMSAIWKDALYQGLFENCSGSTAQMCAVNYLLAKMDPGIARKLTNDSFVPDVKVAPRVMEDMLQRVIVLSLRLYKFFNETTSPGNSTVKTGTTRLLKERQDSTTTTTQSNTNNQWRLRNSLNAAEPDEWLVSEVDGTVVTSIEKVSVAKPMLYISAAVLAYIFVILVYRMWVRQTMLGHLPTSLAETWAVLYATDAIGGGAEYSEGNGVDRGDAFEEERWMGVVKGKKIVHPVELRRRKFTGTYAYGEFYKRGGGIGGGGRGEHHFGVYCREFEEQGDGWGKEVGGSSTGPSPAVGFGAVGGAVTWGSTAYDPGSYVNQRGGVGTVGYGGGFVQNPPAPQMQQYVPPEQYYHQQSQRLQLQPQQPQRYSNEPETYYYNPGIDNGNAPSPSVGYVPTPQQSVDDYGNSPAASQGTWGSGFGGGRGGSYDPLPPFDGAGGGGNAYRY